MKNSTLFRNDWVEIANSKGIALEYSTSSYFDNRHMLYIALFFIKFFIHLPIYSKREPGCDYPSYGFYFYGRQFVICLGMNKKHISLPWDYEWVRTSYYLKDGSWAHDNKKNRKSGIRVSHYEPPYEEKIWYGEYPFTSFNSDGSVQKIVTAKVRIEEREWRYLIIKYLPFFKKVCRSIWADYSDEIGPECGSWKGGTVGSGIDMRKGETPLEALRRLELRSIKSN